MALSAEILRVITAPYAVSLINLDDILRRSGQHEVQAWADSHPCQIQALSKVAMEALQYCPYGLSVIERLGVVQQLRDEMLQHKPIMLDMLMRSALQDEMNFQKFSPTLVALLSTPLPPQFPPPAKLVAFFLECLDWATKSPSISTIRPLYVLVANGYKHLALQMSENQSHGFAKRMAGFLAEKGSADADVNTFLTYCLATLAHMHLATGITAGKTAIGEFFQGKKAPMVLTLVINIVNVLASPETKRDWQEKTSLIRMATVIVSAVSDQVKGNGASNSDAASLVRLLEKARAQEDTRVVSEVLQFASALSQVTPAAHLKSTMEKLLCRGRKEETTVMFLPLISTGFFAQDAPQRLVSDMLRSVIKHASSTNNQPTHSSYLLLRDRIEFIQKLSDDVPHSPHLRHHVLAALSTPELVVLVNDFINYTNRPPVASEACGEGEACQWSIFSLTNRLQLVFCTFILRCTLYSQEGGEGEGAQPLPASTATKIMEKLGSLSAAVQSQCPFEKTLKSKTSHHDILSLIEEAASPEARISSRNWRQSLMQGLARDTDRQHGFIVSTVSEICRDLERRCENVEKPLRAEEENSRRLQAEVEKLKAHCTDVEEQMRRCIHNLNHASAENEMLENKLDSAMEKTKEAMERVKELEEVVDVEREEARQNIEELERELADTRTKLERELLETKSSHLEELRAVKDAADAAAMEHMAALNSRQETIDQLQKHKRELEQDAQNWISSLKEEKGHLERKVEILRKDLAAALQELGASKAQIEDFRHENETLGADKMALHNRMAGLEKNLDETCHELDRYKACLAQKISDLDQQGQMLDELDHQRKRQKEQICLLERARDDLNARVQEMQTAIRAGEEKLLNVTTKHEQVYHKTRLDHQAYISALTTQHATAIDNLRCKLDQAHKDSSRERDQLREEINSLNLKLSKFRTIHEEREREAQNHLRRLMGLMSGGGPGLAALLGGGADTESPIKLSAAAAATPTTTRRRKSEEGHAHDGSDTSPSVQKRMRPWENPQASSPTRPPPQQAHLGFRAVKTPHNKPLAATSPAAKKQQQQEPPPPPPPSSQEMVKETPISPVLTSTPKGVGVQYVWERRRTIARFEDDVEEPDTVSVVGWNEEETM